MVLSRRLSWDIFEAKTKLFKIFKFCFLDIFVLGSNLSLSPLFLTTYTTRYERTKWFSYGTRTKNYWLVNQSVVIYAICKPIFLSHFVVCLKLYMKLSKSKKFFHRSLDISLIPSKFCISRPFIGKLLKIKGIFDTMLNAL